MDLMTGITVNGGRVVDGSGCGRFTCFNDLPEPHAGVTWSTACSVAFEIPAGGMNRGFPLDDLGEKTLPCIMALTACSRPVRAVDAVFTGWPLRAFLGTAGDN